ncbi:MAG: caspase family protein [Burkholderiaceae bacterium]
MNPNRLWRALIIIVMMAILTACTATRRPHTTLPDMAPRAGAMTPYALKVIEVHGHNGMGAQTQVERMLPTELGRQFVAANVFGSDLKHGYTLRITYEDTGSEKSIVNVLVPTAVTGEGYRITALFELIDAGGTVVHYERVASSARSNKFSGRARQEDISRDLTSDLASRYTASLTAALSRKTPSPAAPSPTAPPIAQPPADIPSRPPAVSALARQPAADAAADVFGRYHALIIGNNEYRNLPILESAVPDARRVDAVLSEKYGFETRLLLNVGRAEILGALYDLRRKLTPRDNLLIYYAGHGWLDEQTDEGYWLPVNAEQESTATWISNASLTAAIRAMEAKHVMIVADSCFSGRLTREVLTELRTPSHVQRMAALRARTALTSGGLEPVLDGGGTGNHSVFASAFLGALESNRDAIDMSALFSRVRRAVALEADQIPEYGDIRRAGHQGGDFVFVPARRGP